MRWQRWLRFSIIPCLLLLAFALLMPYVYQAREAARRSTSKNNLKQIGLAIHNYHETHGSLPPGGVIRMDGTAMNGWNSMLLPFVDASPYYSMLYLDESWQSPVNINVFEKAIHYLLISGSAKDHFTTTGYGITHYLGNPNLLYCNSSVRLNQMQKGLAHTWMTGEVAGNYQPWGYPFNWRPLGTKLCEGPESFGYPAWDGGHLLMADGRVSFFSHETSPEILKRLAEAPPVSTEEQTARPSKIFQTGNFRWESIDLQFDAKSKTKYISKVLRNPARNPLVIYVYDAANITPEELSQQKYIGYSMHYLLQIDSTTDIPQALKSTSMFKTVSPEQLQTNVKTLQAIQGQLE